MPAEYRESLRKIRYTVSDLTGDDKAAAAELASLVRKLVAPESWQAAGGRGSVEPEQGVLVVVQTGEVHQQVLTFCEKLRAARQKPLRSHERPERFTLTTHADEAREMLDRPVTVNFHEPAPLGRTWRSWPRPRTRRSWWTTPRSLRPRRATGWRRRSRSRSGAWASPLRSCSGRWGSAIGPLARG